MYVIEANDPYTRRSEYLAGFDDVTRRAIWTRDSAVALHFADQESAKRLNSEALLGRAAQSSEI
jgi:hypothetical protein